MTGKRPRNDLVYAEWVFERMQN